MEPVKLLERAASSAAHALRHPISSAAYTAGMARGLVGAALHGATATGHDPDAGPRPVPTQRTSSGSAGAPVPPSPPPVPAPVRPPVPAAPGEQFATEPKAVSREAEHGGPATDAEIDAWIDEAMARGEDADVETPAATGPLLDPSIAKAIRSESEMLRRDAERDPE